MGWFPWLRSSFFFLCLELAGRLKPKISSPALWPRSPFHFMERGCGGEVLQMDFSEWLLWEKRSLFYLSIHLSIYLCIYMFLSLECYSISSSVGFFSMSTVFGPCQQSWLSANSNMCTHTSYMRRHVCSKVNSDSLYNQTHVKHWALDARETLKKTKSHHLKPPVHWLLSHKLSSSGRLSIV